MTQLRTAGIHHITLVAADASRTLAFYRDMLGMTLLKRAALLNDSHAHHLQFGDSDGLPGTLVTVLVQPPAARGRWGIGGVHHFALGTKNEDTQLEWKRWLIDRGIGVTGPFDRGYFSSIYFADPDGQILEIARASRCILRGSAGTVAHQEDDQSRCTGYSALFLGTLRRRVGGAA